ncbi:hypothetical protein SEA_TREAT_65 [Streptomyces phage Treat]|nr:hypothetical protein SEA_TREAT_65 [Streptomyces phage Treat]
MQVTYRIPSKKVPYGYLEFTTSEGESLPDPVTLAEDYAQYVKDYQSAEVQAFENPTAGQLKRADKSIEEATKILDEGLGGVEEIDEDAPVKPWNKTETAATATEEKKPWTAEAGDWDFS